LGKWRNTETEEFGCHVEAEEVVLLERVKPTGAIYTPLEKSEIGIREDKEIREKLGCSPSSPVTPSPLISVPEKGDSMTKGETKAETKVRH